MLQVVSEVCVFRVVCLLSKPRSRPCVLQIGNFIHCVKICTPPNLMPLHPLYPPSQFWLQACVIVQMIGLHRQYDRRPQHSTLKCLVAWILLGFSFYCEWFKGASPIITHEKCTQPSVWTNWGSFVCFAFSQCRNLMFSPLELGLALVSYLLTSTSFGSSWWPAAGLQLHIWPLLPLQSADGLSQLVSAACTFYMSCSTS